MSFGRLLFGAILVGIGGVLLASQLGYLPQGVMPWFLQFWPLLLVLIGIALLANAMKTPLLGWLAALLALAAIGLGGWWLAHHKADARMAHASQLDLGPRVEALTIRTRTLGGKLEIFAAPARSDSGTERRGRSLGVWLRGVSAKDAEHKWSVDGRSGVFEWPAHVLVPHTAPLGADLRLEPPAHTPIRLQTQCFLSGADLDLFSLRPQGCDVEVVSGGLTMRLGRSVPQRIAVRGTLGGVEILLPAEGPVRVEFLSPFTARSLPDDFMEHVGGRGKARIWVSEGRGTPLLITVDGTFLYVKIKRQAQHAA